MRASRRGVFTIVAAAVVPAAAAGAAQRPIRVGWLSGCMTKAFCERVPATRYGLSPGGHFAALATGADTYRALNRSACR